MKTKTAVVAIFENCVKNLRVSLDRPVKTRPTIGKTGAPQPTTLHGPVESPRVLARTPATPPFRLAV
jgi:hypothetical protein